MVAASWHAEVMDGLLDGADRALRAYKVEAPVVFRVPGAFELPVAASAWPPRATTPWSPWAW